jgi:hypothetical protein
VRDVVQDRDGRMEYGQIFPTEFQFFRGVRALKFRFRSHSTAGIIFIFIYLGSFSVFFCDRGIDRSLI